MRVAILVVFAAALITSTIDFGIARLSDKADEPSFNVTLDTDPGSLLSEGRPAQVDIATRHESTGTLLCVAAIFEFPDDGARIAELETSGGLVPSVTITGPLVLFYGDGPLSNTPSGFEPGFRFRPQIDLDTIDWTPIPPGYPADSMQLTLPTWHSYRPGTQDDPDPSLKAFGISTGCFVLADAPSEAEGIAKTRYTFTWGDRATTPVVSSATDDVEVSWQFMHNRGESLSQIEPGAKDRRNGVPVESFPYNQDFSVDVMVTDDHLQTLVTIANWTSAGLGALILGALFKLVFDRRKEAR